MGFKSFACMHIAIIGTGRATTAMAQGLSRSGHVVYMGVKDGDESRLPFWTSAFDDLTITSIAEASAAADLIIISSCPSEVREAAYQIDDVRKKVIIDASYMSYIDGEPYVNTLQAIKSITGSQLVAKCFNPAGFEQDMKQEMGDKSINMFVAGDNKKAKEVAKLISRDLGYADCLDFGGSDTAPLLDEMAVCCHHLALRQKHGEKIAIRITRN